jgi:hypothetical protein
MLGPQKAIGMRNAAKNNLQSEIDRSYYSVVSSGGQGEPA